MRINRKLLFLGVFTFFLVIFALLAYRAEVILKSGNPLLLVEKKLQEIIGEKISLGSVGIELYRGPLLTLTDLSVGEPGRFHLVAGAAHVSLSKWDLLFGRFNVKTILLENPEVALPAAPFLPENSSPLPPLPRIRIKNGSLTVQFKGETHILSAINGQFHQGQFNVSTRFRGAPANIKGGLKKKGWEASVELKELLLEKFHGSLSGSAAMNLTLSQSPGLLEIGLMASAKDLSLPGPRVKMEKASLTARGKMEEEKITIGGFTLETPFISLSGEGKLLAQTDISLKMESSEFNYEQLVKNLPAEHFPKWLNVLLGEQIRDGKSRFSTIAYKGKVSDLLDPSVFADNLSIEMDVNGQSFGSSFHPHRVTGLTGKLHFRKGGIEVINITGTAGGSKLKSVDLFFPRIMDEKFRLKVAADLDMEVADFLLAWQAILEPMYIHELLKPVTHVRKGRVKGRVIFEQEGYSVRGMGISGNARLEGCSFKWNDHSLDDLSCTGFSKKPGGPVLVDGSVTFNGYPVTNIKLLIDDVFGKQPYRFSLKSGKIPENKYLRLSKDAQITLDGEGEGPEITGHLGITTKEIHLPGATFGPPSSMLLAEGKLSAMLYPELSMDLTKILVKSGSRAARLDARIDSGGCLLGIKGEVDLVQTAPEAGDVFKGGIEVWVDLIEEAPLKGSLYFHGFSAFSGERTLTLSGPAVIQGRRLVTEGMDAGFRGLKMFLAGSLLMEEKPFFSGDMEIKGLKAGREAPAFSNLPEEFDLKARLTLINADLFGMPIKRGSADANLQNGNLTLTDTKLHLSEGSIKGSAAVGKAGETTFNLSIDLKGADISKYLSLATGDKPSVVGTMDLSGNLFGSMDTLNGNLVFSARNGKIKKYSLLSKVFGAMNVYKILKSGGTDLVENGFPYNFITSTFTIENGIMGFEDFSMDSNSLPVSAVGTYNIYTDKLDAVMAAQLLETVDKALGFVPVLGWLLTGDDHRLFVVNLKIMGDPDDPSVRIMPIDTVSTPVTETLLRILKLPKEIITDPGQLIIPGGKPGKD